MTKEKKKNVLFPTNFGLRSPVIQKNVFKKESDSSVAAGSRLLRGKNGYSS